MTSLMTRKVLLKRASLEKNLVRCLYYGWRDKGRQAESYVDSNDDIVITRVHRPSDPIPKRIWIYWDSPVIPALVKATINRLRTLNSDHEINILNQNTVRELVKNELLDRDDIARPHKSDLVRLELLVTYGGIWIDGTCIFSESLDWVHAARHKHAADFIGFYRSNVTTDFSSPILENWFLCATPGSEFFQQWLGELYKAHSQGIGQYYGELKSRADFPSLLQKIERPEYLVAYTASQVVARRLGNVNMFLRRAESSAYFYQDRVGWDRERVAETLAFLKFPDVPMPVIKLTHSNRYLLPLLIKRRLFIKESILGKFVLPILTG